MPASGLAAAGKFTIVIGGKITSVESVDGSGGGKLVHAKAVAEMAKAAGFGLSLDAGTGIVSLTRGGTDVDNAFRGWKSGVTFVVDGKIVKVSSKAVAGAPYIASADLKKISELMGFEADLEGTVLALSGGGGAVAAATPILQGGGMNSDLLRAMGGGTLPGMGGATATAPTHDGSVCGYMDSQKVLWSATEPNALEKETFQKLADQWSDKKNKGKGNRADLELFEKTLKGFHTKATTRLNGTRDSSPPAPARAWYDASVTYLVKVDQILKLSFDMIRVMKLPEDKQKPEFEQLKKNIDLIKKMDTEQKAIGSAQVEATYAVREQNGCSPP